MAFDFVVYYTLNRGYFKKKEALKMRNTVRFVSIVFVSILTCMFVMTSFVHVRADMVSGSEVSSVNYTQVDNSMSSSTALEEKADPYVTVVKNQYVLSPEAYNVLGEAEINEVNRSLDTANQFISERGLYLSTNSRTAVLPTVFRGFGKNDFVVHWNYVRIYLDRNWANVAKNGGIGALAAYIGLRVPKAAPVVIAGAIAGILSGINVPHGVWFDYNYAKGITKWGWQ